MGKTSHMENKVNVFHVCMHVLYDQITMIVNMFDYRDSIPCLSICLRFNDPLNYQTAV